MLGGDEAGGSGAVDDQVIADAKCGKDSREDEVGDAVGAGSVAGGEEAFCCGFIPVAEVVPIAFEVECPDPEGLCAFACGGVVPVEERALLELRSFWIDGVAGGEPEFAFGEVIGDELGEAAEDFPVVCDRDFCGRESVLEVELDEEKVRTLGEQSAEQVFELEFLASGEVGWLKNRY
mgnify:CR=1 FL=1